jgi:hypothetical protein
MKKIYISAWFLLAAAAIVTALSGGFNAAALVFYSLIALGLVYTLALWSVIVNTRELEMK